MCISFIFRDLKYNLYSKKKNYVIKTQNTTPSIRNTRNYNYETGNLEI